MRTSRTYKLQLSEKGVDQFLACHCRLARMTREFIPYGTTLHVAMRILDGCDPAEIVAELESPLCGALGGPSFRFVGTTSRLTNIVDRIASRLIESGECGGGVATWRLYNVALIMFLACEDRELQSAYRRAALITS